MPFTSKAQQRYLYSQKPKVAKKFADDTPSIKSLPEKKAKKSTGPKKKSAKFYKRKMKV